MSEAEKVVPAEEQVEEKPVVVAEAEKKRKERSRIRTTTWTQTRNPRRRKRRRRSPRRRSLAGYSFGSSFLGSIKPTQRCLGGFVDWYVKSGQTADLETPVRALCLLHG